MTKSTVHEPIGHAQPVEATDRSTWARHDVPDVPLVATPDGTETTLGPTRLPPRVAEPGISDDAIRRGTGKTWDEWFALLDRWQAAQRTHSEIARCLREEHGVDGWWAQGVTVGYERARGMRAKHERPDGFSVNASKIVPVPVARLFAAFVEEVARDRWLEPGTLRLRTAQPSRSARFDVVANGTRLAVTFAAKGDAKTSVQIEHQKLPIVEDVDTWRAFWKARLDRLSALLAGAG